MANPPAAGFPIPPPVGNIQFIDLSTGRLTLSAWEFLQKLWAAIQGTGGLLDLTLVQSPIVASILAAAEGLAAQQPPTPILPTSYQAPGADTEFLLRPAAVLAGRAATAEVAGSLEEHTFTYTGDVTGGPTAFDGTTDVSTALTLATTQPAAHTWENTQTVAPAANTDAQLVVTSTGTADSYMRVNGPAGRTRNVQFETADVLRWRFRANTTAESGTNAGSNLEGIAYDDAGAALGTWLFVNRANYRIGLGATTLFAARLTVQQAVAGSHAIWAVADSAGRGQRWSNSDYVSGSVGTLGTLNFGAGSGDTYLGLTVAITGATAAGTFAVQPGGTGFFAIGKSTVPTNARASIAGVFHQDAVTVAALPAAAAALAGARATVTDATQTLTAGIGAVVAGGGANNVPVYCDGANWLIG